MGHQLESLEQVQGTLALIMQHWNHVAATLLDGGPFTPVLARGAVRTAGSDWSRGYSEGTRLRAHAWRPFLDDPAVAPFLNAILALSGQERKEAPALRQVLVLEGAGDAVRKERVASLGANVLEVYRGVRAAQGPGGIPVPGLADPHWEVGVVPLTGHIEDDPKARPVGVLVVDEQGEVLHLGVDGHPPADAERLAAIVASHVGHAARKRRLPPVIWVRHPAFGIAIANLPSFGDVALELREVLPNLDEVSLALAREFGSPQVTGNVAHSATWAGWGLAPAAVDDLHAAGAQFYLAAPWKLFADEPAFLLQWSADDTWAASVLGSAGIETGLALFTDPDDCDVMFSGEMSGFAGAVYSLLFVPQDDLHPARRKEIRGGSWQVVSANAQPDLFVLNAPTAGVTEEAAARLAVALGAFARMAEDRRRTKKGKGLVRARIQWRDPESGLTIRRASDR
jgi:hypothetical protein